MGQLGPETIYPKPRLSLGSSEYKVYPYLLRRLEINRPNQVWSTDITHVPMPQGFL
jgi:putative transposase